LAPLLKKVEKKGEVDRVHRVLKDAILQGEVRPGDFLVEVDLARRCKTSRTPVREACNRLSQEGWISQIRYKGYFVPTISVREIVELYDYRKLLECHTAERVAETASDDQIATIAATTTVERDPQVKPDEFIHANEAFHLAVAAAAGNRRIFDQLKFILEHVRRFDILAAQRSSGWMTHAEILQALEARNPTLARKAMGEHIDGARDRMLKLLGG
jgi:DNA-binding GntR family transcriptional regulator